MDVNILSKGNIISRAKYCDSFFSKFKGLMFSKKLKKDRSLVLVGKNISVHMLFVFFSLDIIFLDSNKRVVDIKKGNPFAPFISPKEKSKYVIEMNQGENTLKMGDKILFKKFYK